MNEFIFYLTINNLLVYSEQLQKLKHTAVHRSEIADFLCLQVKDYVGIISPIYISMNFGRCGVLVRITDLTVCRFLKHRPFQFQKKTYSTMKNTVDVNAYLLELYLHTEQITDPSQNPQQFNEFVAAFEHCWNRYKETSQPLNAGMVHMMLGLLNLSIHMVEQALSGHDRFQLRNRLSVIKSELIHGITLFLPKQEQLSA